MTRMIRASAGVERVHPLTPTIDALVRKGALRLQTQIKGIDVFVVTAAGRRFAAAYAEHRAAHTVYAARRAAAAAAREAGAGRRFEVPAYTDEVCILAPGRPGS